MAYEDGAFDATYNTGLPSYQAPQLPPGVPPGATMVSPTQWVVYGPNGQVQSGGNIGGAAPPPPQTNQNAYNNPYAYTGNNLNTPYSQRFAYPGVPGLSPGALGGEGGNGQFQGGPVQGYSGAPTDRNAIRAWFATQTSDPDYWADRAMEKGGINDSGGYWSDFVKQTANGGGGGYGGSQGMSYSGMMQGMPGFNAPQFGGYGFSAAGGINAPAPFEKPSDFSFGSYTRPQDFNADTFGYKQGVPQDVPNLEKFQAPTLDETNDPGYKFRLQQAMQAIQNQSSSQGARGGDVLKAMQDYSQNYASSEYEKVYGRAFGSFTEEQQRAQALYQARLQQQAQGFGQAFNTSSLNSQNAMGAAALNSQNQLAEYQTNFNAQDLMHQQNFENAFNVYQGNFGNQLQAAQLNSQNTNAANALGWQVASGTYDRNYDAALAQYSLPFSMGMQLANYNLGAQGQGFNQALAGYNTNYNAYTGTQGTQYSNLYNQAQMGLSANNNLYNSPFATNQPGYPQQQGNINAANNMAQGAANSNLVTGLNSAANTGLIAASPLNPYGNSQYGVQPRSPYNPYGYAS